MPKTIRFVESTEPPVYLLSVSKAARFIGVSDGTLNAWRNKPELGLPAPLRIGDRLYYLQRELEAWLESRRERAAQ
jgi:hypothetical protein